MAEIDSLGSYYYAGVQNSAIKTQKEKAAEKTNSAKRIKFSDLLKSSSSVENLELLYPQEIENMSVTDAVLFLRDAAEVAGNELAEQISLENLQNFKIKIKQFLTYVEKNNYAVTKSVQINRRTKKPVKVSPLPMFSSYEIPQHELSTVSFTVIDEKLDELTREMLSQQADNIKILATINELKGLIIDLLD